MDRKIEDYLPLYLGCEVFGTYDDASGSKGYLTGVTNGGIECEIQFILEDGINVEEEPQFNEAKEVKLAIRKVSEMKLEEMKELWKVVFNREFGRNGEVGFYDSLAKESKPNDISRWVLWSGVERLGIQFDGKIWADSDLGKWDYNQHEVTRWLLSKHFDLFGLIPAGLAIDATTLKK